MNLFPPYCAPSREDLLQALRTCSRGELDGFRAGILAEDALPRYINTLDVESREIALRACLVCWAATKEHLIPREMQLKNIIADRQGHNSLVSAGTGSGKTLPIAVNILLDDPAENTITITVSPMKRLQVTHNQDSNEMYGIRSEVINEDTPGDESWWQKHIFNKKDVPDVPVRHLIVTVEQLFKTQSGHLPRLGEWLRTNTSFQKLVVRINVDESHFIYTAGEALYGLPAFRRAFGQLEHLKRQLPSGIRWHFYSATFPPHILSHIQSHLLAGNTYDFIQITSNRPNIMYATHEVVGALEELRNYDCFLTAPFDITLQPHVLIFVDDKRLTTRITRHLRSSLPPDQRDKGIVRYYHSVMSQAYLEQTHEAFVSSQGTCRILVATSGQSVGVDFPNVQIVCNVGLPSNMVDALQRGGRAGRNGAVNCLFALFYYPSWALEIDQQEYHTTDAGSFKNDPDRPRGDLRDNAKQRERAPLSLVNLLQSDACLRGLFAKYLNDTTASGLDYTSRFCCDRHCVNSNNTGPDSLVQSRVFHLGDHLPGPLYVSSGIKRKEQGSRQRSAYRPKVDRKALDSLLVDWVLNQVDSDLLLRESYDILSKEHRKKLICMPSKDITSALSIVRALDETEEWGKEFAAKLFELVQAYDKRLEGDKETARAQASAQKAAAKAAEAPTEPRNKVPGRLSEDGAFFITTMEDMREFVGGESDEDAGIQATGSTRTVRRKTTK